MDEFEFFVPINSATNSSPHSSGLLAAAVPSSCAFLPSSIAIRLSGSSGNHAMLTAILRAEPLGA
jgi:hypothetical protein